MTKDLVIGIDSSTTATKAIAWTGDGQLVAEGRCPIALKNPAPLYYEQDARDWWKALCAALGDLGQKIDLLRTASVSIANQRETWVPERRAASTGHGLDGRARATGCRSSGSCDRQGSAFTDHRQNARTLALPLFDPLDEARRTGSLSANGTFPGCPRLSCRAADRRLSHQLVQRRSDGFARSREQTLCAGHSGGTRRWRGQVCRALRTGQRSW